MQKNNVKIFLFGLDRNIFKEWFGEMESVFNMVDCKIVKTAVCECCGGTAKFSMIDDDEVYKNRIKGEEFISTHGKYLTVCERCHPMS